MDNSFMALLSKKAPDFPPGYTWLNTKKPISLASLAGNIVILDFWTYCCINCIHTIPVLAQIEEKYKGKPVVVIGVHSAKYENEKDSTNIKEAISRYEINHPVIVDQEMYLWASYGVNAWPTIVIIGADGKIAHKAAGEISFQHLDQLVSDTIITAKQRGTLAKNRAKIDMPARKDTKILSYPGKISFLADGSKFALSDSNHNRILIVDTKSGKIIKKIGTGAKGLEDGNLSKAMFFRPQGIFWQKDLIYVADTENHAIRQIDLKSEKVSTIAGTGEKGFYLDHAANYPAKTTTINSPWDLASDGNKLYIAMAGLHQIWQYSIKDARISVFAGSGRENLTDGTLQSSDFAQPSGIFLFKDNLYVADSETSSIRSISIKEEFVSTVVGKGLFTFGDKVGSYSNTLMQHPLGICINQSGNTLYIADTYNGSIKAIDLKSRTTYNVISGKGEKSMCRIDDPSCDTLGLYEPNDVKIFGDTLYIADTNNNLVRKFNLKEMVLKTLNVK